MDYWDIHGVLFLLGCTFFPRLTVFFFSQVSGGLIFWIFFLMFPRIVIPILAAYHYWDTNPILVVVAVVVCLGGEAGEKQVFRRSVAGKRSRS